MFMSHLDIALQKRRIDHSQRDQQLSQLLVIRRFRRSRSPQAIVQINVF